MRASVSKPSAEPLQNGVLRLLDLKEKWFFVPTHEEADTAKRADRSYADRLKGKVLKLITIEENPPIGRDTVAIGRTPGGR